MFKVVETFVDLQDKNFKYEVGDEYPRLGLKPSLARITELSSSDNKRGLPLIEEVKEEVEEVVENKAEEKPKKKTSAKKSGKK